MFVKEDCITLRRPIHNPEKDALCVESDSPCLTSRSTQYKSQFSKTVCQTIKEARRQNELITLKRSLSGRLLKAAARYSS